MHTFVTIIVAFILAMFIIVFMALCGFVMCLDKNHPICAGYTLMSVLIPMFIAIISLYYLPNSLLSYTSLLITIILIPSILIDRGIINVPDQMVNFFVKIWAPFAWIVLKLLSFTIIW